MDCGVHKVQTHGTMETETMVTKDLDRFLADPAVPYWIKDTVRTALRGFHAIERLKDLLLFSLRNSRAAIGDGEDHISWCAGPDLHLDRLATTVAASVREQVRDEAFQETAVARNDGDRAAHLRVARDRGGASR